MQRVKLLLSESLGRVKPAPRLPSGIHPIYIIFGLRPDYQIGIIGYLGTKRILTHIFGQSHCALYRSNSDSVKGAITFLC